MIDCVFLLQFRAEQAMEKYRDVEQNYDDL